MKSVNALAVAVIVAGLAASSGVAAVDVRIDAQIRVGKALPPPPPEVVVVDRSGPQGPPPWAPAHGRRGRDYYFYPECDVYYRPSDRVWFYMDGGDWRFGARLPDSVRIDFGRSVSLTLEGDRPYVHHKQVVSYFPHGYFTKVKFKDARDSRGGNGSRSHGDDQGRGKGKDKGKGKGGDR